MTQEPDGYKGPPQMHLITILLNKEMPTGGTEFLPQPAQAPGQPGILWRGAESG